MWYQEHQLYQEQYQVDDDEMVCKGVTILMVREFFAVCDNVSPM